MCKGVRPLIRALTFDVWQTVLYDPYEPQRCRIRAAGMSRALARHGVELPPARLLEAYQACAQHRAQQRTEREMAPGAQISWILRACGLPTAPAASLATDLREAYCEASLQLPPGVFGAAPGVLELLAGRYKMALICNTGTSPGVVMRALLSRLGLWQYFELMIASDELGWRKPNPRLFAAALAGLEVEPQEAVHIGDDPWTDAGGAKRFGMRAILLRGGWHDTRPHREPRDGEAVLPDAVVSGLDELPQDLIKIG